MAVTTPELLRPDSLTVTISQVPGVSPTRSQGRRQEVEAQPTSGEDNTLAPLLLPLTVLGSPAPNPMQPKPLLSPIP